jgi:predicted ATP-grasp superfamily ATP-dependent carboligase
MTKYTSSDKSENQPIALVIGLCSHGLAMTRALSRAGVEVHAFEANSSLPGTKTSTAKVHLVASIKNESLVHDLINFKQLQFQNRKIVLLATNDNNVKVIGINLELLKVHYLISWEKCHEKVLSLLLKNNIEARCRETNLNYPKSFVLDNTSLITEVEHYFEFPIIAKPVKPQSGFKARKCKDIRELRTVCKAFQNDLPFLLQDWIDGTDEDLHFCALYLKEGVVSSKLSGQKLASYPPAMGQTTVAVTTNNPEVQSLTEIFFEGLEMSGPVSLELKQDIAGRYWVIEPTIGRTDFWVGLCIDAGYNILFEEYSDCLGQDINHQKAIKPTIWFDSERDITAFPRFIKKSLPFNEKVFNTSFSFLAKHDLTPFFFSLKNTFIRRIKSVAKKAGINKKTVLEEHQIEIYGNYRALPNCFKDILNKAEKNNIFTGSSWFDNYCYAITEKNSTRRFFCLRNVNREAIAILPLQQQESDFYGFKLKCLQSLSNYYSPYFNVAINDELTTNLEAYILFLEYFTHFNNNWDLVELFPLEQEQAKLLEAATGQLLLTHLNIHTINWYNEIVDSYQNYVDQLSSRLKNTIKRKSKKLEKLGCWQVKIYQTEEDVNTALEQYLDVYSNSWKPIEPFDHFIEGLVKIAAVKGWLRIGVLSVDNQPIATQLWLVANKTAYIYKLAYRQEFSYLSPGTILTEKMISYTVIKDNVTKIDFLTGNDDFKKDWMANSRKLFKLRIFYPFRFKSVLGYFKEKISYLNS